MAAEYHCIIDAWGATGGQLVLRKQSRATSGAARSAPNGQKTTPDRSQLDARYHASEINVSTDRSRRDWRPAGMDRPDDALGTMAKDDDQGFQRFAQNCGKPRYDRAEAQHPCSMRHFALRVLRSRMRGRRRVADGWMQPRRTGPAQMEQQSQRSKFWRTEWPTSPARHIWAASGRLPNRSRARA
jgi:hypothetical protein